MSFDLHRIGQTLKQVRIEKGLSLDDVSHALFIRKSALGAIESGYWDKLPHPVYVKGYVKLYACYLNIAEEVDAELRLWLPPVMKDETPKQERCVEATSRKRSNRFTRHFLLICSSVIVLVAAFVFYPAQQGKISLTKLQQVSIGFFDTGHSMIEVRKLLIPYTQRPWLNPFAEAGETRTMILDLPDTNPMTSNEPPSNVTTHDEG